MDVSDKDGFDTTFWNKSYSWTLKYAKNYLFCIEYKNNLPAYSHWYYFGLYYPEYKERFPFSSTVFVFVTDGWHLMQFFCLNSSAFCIVYAAELNLKDSFLFYGLIKLSYAVFFNLFYDSKLIRKI